jgi:two-component system response regulator MprA
LASASVLLADDEEAVRDSLERALQLERLNVILARDGQEALDLLAVVSPDLMILDVSMPRVDGLEVCRRLRDTGDRTPVLMLTARDAVEHRVEGLDAGADDYLVKPFALAELKARVRALLRRVDAPGEASGLTLSDLRMDTTTYDVFRGERRIALTRTEFQLLRYFLENARQVLSRTQLFEGVWGYDFGATSNSLGVHIGYLRRKLEEGDEPRLLHTIRGVGYILRESQ